MRFTCRLCFHPVDTAGQLLAHAATAHPEMGELPTTWPDGRDVTIEEFSRGELRFLGKRPAARHAPEVEVDTAVGQDVTHTKAWRAEDWR